MTYDSSGVARFRCGFLKFINLILKKSNLKTLKSLRILGGGQGYEVEIEQLARENVLVVLLDKEFGLSKRQQEGEGEIWGKGWEDGRVSFISVQL